MAGLYLAVSANGSTRSWRFRSASGWCRLGRHPGLSPFAAVAKAEEMRRELDRGTDPVVRRRTEKAEAKVKASRSAVADYAISDMIRDYLDEVVSKRRSAQGRRNPAQVTSRYLGKLGAWKCLALAADESDRVHNHILAIARHSEGQAYEFRKTCRAAWKHAKQSKRLGSPAPASPFDVGGKLKAYTPRTRWLHEGELHQFLAWCKTVPESVIPAWCVDALLLALFTCVRSGYIMGMRWDEIHPDPDGISGGVWLRPDPSKNGRVYSAQLSRQAVAILQKRRDAADSHQKFVFAREDRSDHRAQIDLGSAVGEARTREGGMAAGLARFTAHDMRRTCRSYLGQLRVKVEVHDGDKKVERFEKIDRKVIRLIMWHSDDSVDARHYDMHEANDEQRAALQTWADFCDNVSAATIVPMAKRELTRKTEAA